MNPSIPSLGRILVGFVMGLSVVQAASANQSLTAEGWYERMLQEAPKAQYQGIFTHQSGGQSQSVEIVHGMKEGQVWERLLHLDGPAREVIRKGEQLFCIYPDARVEKIEQPTNGPFAAESMVSTQQLQQGYEFVLHGAKRIAGRPAVLVQLKPKDELRHHYLVWLDHQTSVALKSELVNQRGQVLERYQFNYFAPYDQWNEQMFSPRTQGIELAFQNTAAAAERAPANTDTNTGSASTAKSEQHAETELTVQNWKLNWLPTGFLQKENTQTAMQRAHDGRRMYSDGIVMFSVYVEPAHEDKQDGLAQVGATVLAVQHKQWQGVEHRITVVGEIPQQTAKRIAQSVELM